MFYRILWDMDGSFGNRFTLDDNNEVVFMDSRDESAYEELMTFEMKLILEYEEDLWHRVSQRYAELRTNVFDPELIKEYATLLKLKLKSSGVLIREAKKHPNENITEDIDWLGNWIERRIEYLDNYYKYER